MAKTHTPASSQHVFATRLALMLVGCFLLAYGSVMIIQASMGASPWNVLDLGIINHLHMLTLGRASHIVSFSVLVAAMILGVRPNVGTLANILIVGTLLDVVKMNGLVPEVTGLLPRSLCLLGGLLVTGIGIAGYVCAGFGTGPRDSLVLGITRKTGLRVGPIRSFLESSVVLVGFLLGGPIGVGTVLSAVLTGPIVEQYMLLLARIRERPFWAEVIHLPASVRIGNLAVEE